MSFICHFHVLFVLVHELMLKKKLQIKDIMRIAAGVTGVKFMNGHGVAYRDLNTQRILLDKHGNACLGDMGIVTACKSVGEAMEYETDGYRWLAPEVCIILIYKSLIKCHHTSSTYRSIGHNLIPFPAPSAQTLFQTLVIIRSHNASSTSPITVQL